MQEANRKEEQLKADKEKATTDLQLAEQKLVSERDKSDQAEKEAKEKAELAKQKEKEAKEAEEAVQKYKAEVGYLFI